MVIDIISLASLLTAIGVIAAAVVAVIKPIPPGYAKLSITQFYTGMDRTMFVEVAVY